MDESLDQAIDKVRTAFYATRPNPAEVQPAMIEEPYVAEVYEDYVIVRLGEGMWKVPYTRDENDVTFASRDVWQEVEQTYVDKALTAIKALPGNRLAHYAVLWGDKDNADLTPYVRNAPGEWFTPDTEELLSVFEGVGKLPWFYQHGGDSKVKATPLGHIDLMGTDEWGIWYQAQLNTSAKYRKLVGHVQQMARDGALGSSSGVLIAARKVAPTGEVKRWPIAEVSATPVPMDPRMLDIPMSEIKAAYKALDLEFPEPEEDPEAIGDEESRQRTHDLALESERLALLDL